ncbi:MAG: hypothetical protein K6L76_05155 [Agarilytica sp.]
MSSKTKELGIKFKLGNLWLGQAFLGRLPLYHTGLVFAGGAGTIIGGYGGRAPVDGLTARLKRPALTASLYTYLPETG